MTPSGTTSSVFFPPKPQRTVLVLGGFPDDTERDVICEKIREIFVMNLECRNGGLQEKPDLLERLNFTQTPRHGSFSGNKDKKFYYGTRQMWHTWDRPKEEVLLSKRVSLAVKTLRTKALEKGVLAQRTETSIDGDWERDRVWYKKLRSEECATTIYRRLHNNSSELVYTGELVPGRNEDFAALWNEAL